MTAPRRTELTPRVARIAEAQGYGSHRESLRVNGGADRSFALTAVALLPAAAWPLVTAYQHAPWRPDGDLVPFLLLGVMGLAFAVLGVHGVAAAVVRARHGRARVHLFGDGVVIERARGDLAGFRYHQATARHVVWDEPWEGGTRARPQLWIDVPGYGRTICLDGLRRDDGAALPVVAEAFGLPVEPEPIGRLPAHHAPAPF